MVHPEPPQKQEDLGTHSLDGVLARGVA